MPDINMQVFEEAQRNQLVTEVDIQTQVALDDYQVQLSDIANPTQSQDNVIIDRHGEFLPHWNESLDFDTWVKMSMEVAGKRILMLHGNSNMGNQSNGINTFIMFDDFSINQLGTYWLGDTGNFGVSGGQLTTNTPTTYKNIYHEINQGDIDIILHYHSKGYVTQGFGHFVMDTVPPSGSPRLTGTSVHDEDRAGGTSQYLKTVSGSETNLGGVSTTDAFHKYDVEIHGTEINWIRDGSSIKTHSSMTSFSKQFVAFTSYSSSSSYCKDILIRKYTAVEPTGLIDETPKNIIVALKSLGRAG